MIDRIESGHQRLDGLLGGGLPANGITLIIGHPGTGKTILAEQYLFHNAREACPGVFLSTVSEPFDKILRYGQTLTFFDLDAIVSGFQFDQSAPGARSRRVDEIAAGNRRRDIRTVLARRLRVPP